MKSVSTLSSNELQWSELNVDILWYVKMFTVTVALRRLNSPATRLFCLRSCSGSLKPPNPSFLAFCWVNPLEWEESSSTWWHHQMETFPAQLAICAGNSPVPVNSPHKGQWRRALMFSLICTWIKDRVNNRGAGDLRRHRGHCYVNVMKRVGRENVSIWWPFFVAVMTPVLFQGSFSANERRRYFVTTLLNGWAQT